MSGRGNVRGEYVVNSTVCVAV